MQRSFRPHDSSMLPDSNMQPGSLLRRLREDPQDALGRIAGDIGARPATSLGEAQVAAYIDGRMRRAGLRVSADAFRAPSGVAWDGLLIALLGLVAVVLYYWLPLPSLFLAIWNVGLAGVGLLRPTAPLLQRKRPSQNVIATRALNGAPRWRVVLLAPLDAPMAVAAPVRMLTAGTRPLRGRVAACGLIVVLAIGGLFGPLELRRLCWYAQFVPAIYVLLLSVLEALPVYARPTAGAANHAGALAVLLQSADALTALQQTELWAVALGDSEGGAGLADLLQRYPFDRQKTLFVGLESIGGGRLSYVTRMGRLPQRPADPLLLRLVAEADAADPLINAEPRPYTSEPPLLHMLGQKRGRMLTVIGLDSDGHPAARGSLLDLPDQIDPLVLDRAIRLVVGLVKKIDTTPDAP